MSTRRLRTAGPGRGWRGREHGSLARALGLGWAAVLLCAVPARSVLGGAGERSLAIAAKGGGSCRRACRQASRACGLQAMVAGDIAGTRCSAGGGARATCRKARRAARKGWRQRCSSMRRACTGCCRRGIGACTAWCGDGEVSGDETCDPPGQTCQVTGRCTDDCRCVGGSTETPPTTLPPALCGNGVVDAGETCDGTATACPAGGACIDCVCHAIVPSVVGDDYPTAERTLIASGLQVRRLEFTSLAALGPPLASIWAQDPTPGSAVAYGSPVDLTAQIPPDPDHFLTFLFRGVSPSAEPEDAYYAAVDPFDRRRTLADWKAVNGFDAPTATAVYLNHNDLGFGRRMVMRRTAHGIAYYVQNYPSVDDAIDERNLIATVAMELSPPDDRVDAPFIKFFTFAADGSRTPLIDLDGRGDKLQPEVCTPCHGGRTSGDYSQNHGDLGARFIPFDLDSFRYSTRAGFTRADQEPALHLLNEAVRDADRQLAAPLPAIAELVEGWYGGPALDRSFDGEFVPSGWRPPLAPAEAPGLYLDVVKAACRGCHVQTTLPFDTYADFASRAEDIARLTCDEAHMPLALRTYGLFWLGPASHALGDFLPGDVEWRELSTPLPGGLLHDVAIATARPELMLAVGESGAAVPWVRSSTDGGATWGDDEAGLPADGAAVQALISPGSEDLRYVVIRGGAAPGLYRRTGGTEWKRDGVGLPAVGDVDGLAAHPGKPSVLYAIVVDGAASALYRTIDGGSTWQLRADGIQSFVLDPDDPAASVLHGTRAGQVVRSADGGATWEPLGPNPSLQFSALVIGRAVPEPGEADRLVIYGTACEVDPPFGCGTWKTVDDGETWTFVGPLSVDATDPFYPGVAYARLLDVSPDTEARLLRTVGDGGRWEVANLAELGGPLADGGTNVRFVSPTRRVLFERGYYFQGRLFVGDKLACGAQVAPGRPRARGSSGLSGVVGQRVDLDGSASLLADGSYTLSWTLMSPPLSEATLRDPRTPHPSFVPDVPGTYAARLEVGRDVGGSFEVADAIIVWVNVSEAPGTVHFARDVVPLFGPSHGDCQQCHQGPSPSGNFDLTGTTDQVYKAVRDRVNLAQPAQGLVLLKPSNQVSHGGGKREGFGVGESSYQTALSWIMQGAPNN
jgi:hypothetical protein